MPETESITLQDLLSREDVRDFVTRNTNSFTTAEQFLAQPVPEGTNPDEMLNLVEFIRKVGASSLVCGQNLNCDHEGSWYALTPALMTRVAHLEYRTRPKGSLFQQFQEYRELKGFYPAQLEELMCALDLDGVSISYEALRELATGERSATNAAERLAANALALLDEIDELSDHPATVEMLEGIFHSLELQVGELPYSPAPRPQTPHFSTCILFDLGFICNSFDSATVLAEPMILFILFMSDNAWKRPLFPRWNNTMEVILRGLFLTVTGMPILRYVPLCLPFWKWQNGVVPTGSNWEPYGAMVNTPYGLDLTVLVSQQLEMLERGLDALAAWTSSQRDKICQCQDAIGRNTFFNHRQKEILEEFVSGEVKSVDAGGYGRRFNVVPSTAYSDLNNLVDRGLLLVDTKGRGRAFFPAPNLIERILH